MQRGGRVPLACRVKVQKCAPRWFQCEWLAGRRESIVDRSRRVETAKTAEQSSLARKHHRSRSKCKGGRLMTCQCILPRVCHRDPPPSASRHTSQRFRSDFFALTLSDNPACRNTRLVESSGKCMQVARVWYQRSVVRDAQATRADHQRRGRERCWDKVEWLHVLKKQAVNEINSTST